MIEPRALQGAACAFLLIAAFAATPAGAHAQSPCGGFYTLRAEDTLAGVADRCGVTLPALFAVNPGLRDLDQLEAGLSIRIPDPESAPPRPAEACGAFYTVQPRENLQGVALACGLTVPLLIAANPGLEERESVLLTPGLRLRIPDVPAGAIAAGDVVVIPGAASGGVPAAPRPADGEDPVGDPEAESEAEPGTELTQLEGVLEAGEPCLLVRTAEGVFALAGRLESFRPGDRVTVLGLEAAEDACQRAPAIQARIVWSTPGR